MHVLCSVSALGLPPVTLTCSFVLCQLSLGLPPVTLTCSLFCVSFRFTTCHTDLFFVLCQLSLGLPPVTLTCSLFCVSFLWVYHISYWPVLCSLSPLGIKHQLTYLLCHHCVSLPRGLLSSPVCNYWLCHIISLQISFSPCRKISMLMRTYSTSHFVSVFLFLLIFALFFSSSCFALVKFFFFFEICFILLLLTC